MAKAVAPTIDPSPPITISVLIPRRDSDYCRLRATLTQPKVIDLEVSRTFRRVARYWDRTAAQRLGEILDRRVAARKPKT